MGMMDNIELKSKSGLLGAHFSYKEGLRLKSFTWNGKEILYEGGAPLIGPHFAPRLPAVLKTIEKKWPEPPNKEGEPFPWGIAGFAPWDINAQTESSFTLELKGKKEWQKAPLSKWEGQDFHMGFSASLTEEKLHMHISVVSELDSVVGLGANFRLPKNEWSITREEGVLSLDPSVEKLYHPVKNPLSEKITLKTPEYLLNISYFSLNQENSWVYKVSENKEFVGIYPLSAQDPWHPNLTVSSIDIIFSFSDLV